jgi:transcriptional regulator with XRE-family HTH domain
MAKTTADSERSPKSYLQRLVGENARNLRITRKLRLKDVASDMGFSVQFLSQLERAKTTKALNVMHIERLCTILGTTPVDLLTPGRYRQGA